NRCFHDCLIIKIDVAGVKDRLPLAAEQNSSRTEYVSGVEKLECQRVSFAVVRAFAKNRDALIDRAPTPTLRCSIRLAMRKERIRHFPDFLALSRHHVDRVVQERIANVSSGLSHENARMRKAPHQYGSGADMVLMGVRDWGWFDFAIAN